MDNQRSFAPDRYTQPQELLAEQQREQAAAHSDAAANVAVAASEVFVAHNHS